MLCLANDNYWRVLNAVSNYKMSSKLKFYNKIQDNIVV